MSTDLAAVLFLLTFAASALVWLAHRCGWTGTL